MVSEPLTAATAVEANARSPSAAADSELPVLTFGDVLELIRRHRRPALTVGAGIALLVLFASALKTPLYEAQATVALDRQPKPVPFVSGGSQFDPFTGNYEHDLLNTQRTIMTSRVVLAAALKTGGLQTNEGYVAIPDAIDKLHERLSVSTSRDSWDLVITLRDEDRRHAEAGLQAVLDAYQAWQLDQVKARSERTLTFLQAQSADALKHVEQSRAEQQAFQKDKALFVIDPERSYPAQRLQQLNSRKVVLSQQLAALQTLVDQIKAIDTGESKEARLNGLLALDAINRNPTVGEQQKLLFELKTQEALLAQKFLEKHPRLIEIRSEIATKQTHLESAVASVHDGLLADYTKLTAQQVALDAAIKQCEGEVNAYRENLFRLQTLEQQTKTNEQIYEQLLKSLKEESISHQEDSVAVAVVDYPRAGPRAVNVSWTFALALALGLGGMGAVAVPLGIEFLGRRIYGAGAVRAQLGAPVLAELPYTDRLPPLGANGDGNQPLRLAEAVRGLRTALRLRRRGESRGQCLALTSCDMGEGKSTLTARLAVNMAMSGLKVLLVDADLRRSTLREQLGQVCERGLSQLLAGDPDMRPSATTYANLDFLDAGAPTPIPGELLNSHCLPEWLEQCRGAYDYVMIDTPPLMAFADALQVAEHCDGIIMVVRDGSTFKSSLAKSRALLAPLAPRILGAALVTRIATDPALARYQAAAATVGAGAPVAPAAPAAQAG